MKKYIFILSALILLAAVSSYGFIRSQVAKHTTEFKVLSTDTRILYQAGSEPLAEATAKYLSPSIKTVESRQFGSFSEPVKIYVFADTKSFSKFAGVSELVKGAGTKNEVYLSGQLLNKMGEIRGMLTHELSHVQLSQTLGTITFNRSLPRWFREGLAIYVADGGGATNATEAETIAQFQQGKHFAPETKGTIFNINLTGSKGLEPKIFYRQSGMFVQFIAHSYPTQFKSFLKGLQAGKNFETHFTETFSSNVNTMLQTFIGTLRKT